jgi:hypothetical protein
MKNKKMNKKFLYMVSAAVFIVIFLILKTTDVSIIEIDINNGLMREQRFIFGKQIKENIKETEFSKLVKKLALNSTSSYNWRLVSYRPNIIEGFSVHEKEQTAYIRVIACCNTFVKYVRVKEFGLSEQKKATAELLHALRNGDIDKLEELKHIYSGGKPYSEEKSKNQ